MSMRFLTTSQLFATQMSVRLFVMKNMCDYNIYVLHLSKEILICLGRVEW